MILVRKRILWTAGIVSCIALLKITETGYTGSRRRTMRLIDPDKLYEDLANNLSSIMGDGSDGEAIDIYVTIGDIIHDTFNAQPTAYDPDKVVEQLGKLKKAEQDRPDDCDEDGCGDGEQIYDDGRSQGRYEAFSKAIEIVKGGGVDAKTDS
jgi:hypothetical protein